MIVFKNDNIQIKTRERVKIVLSSFQNFFTDSTGVFYSHEVEATLIQYDNDGHLMPQDQWFWQTRYPILYEIGADGKQLRTWYSNQKGGYYPDDE